VAVEATVQYALDDLYGDVVQVWPPPASASFLKVIDSSISTVFGRNL
jgi:hypothetical protein